MTTDGGVVMAERATRAVGFWPRHTVRVATRVLPGSTRDRLPAGVPRRVARPGPGPATPSRPDGQPYLRCRRCGKDETDIFGGSKSGPEFDGSCPLR